MRATAKLLGHLGRKDIRNLYNKISDYVKKSDSERTYHEISNIKREVERFSLKNEYQQILMLLRNCMVENPSNEVCESLTEEQKKILYEVFSSDAENPYLLEQIFMMFDLGIQELFNILLYTAYLARAAEIADYTVGRTDKDEKYLSEVKDYQREILDYLEKMAKLLKELSESDELDDYMAEAEERIRKALSDQENSFKEEQ